MNTSISRYIVVAVLLAMSGCSYLLEFEECSATADCGPGLICNADRYCVEVAGSTGNITSEPPCCTQETCAEESATAICAPSCACVEPEGATCKVLEGDPTQEGTVLVGSILPTAGDAASIGIPIEQAVQLAVQELNQGGSLGGGRRLALVACDSSGNVDQGKAAAEHLVALGVPAIVGPAFSGIYIEVSDLITSQNDVLILSPSATSPAITSLDDSGLSWRTVPSDVFQSVAIADRVKDLMASAQIERPRVLAFGKGDAYGNGLLGKVTEELAPTLMSDDDFVGSSYPDPGSTPDIDYAAELTPALDALNARPDFVLLLGTNEIINLLSLIEGEAVTRGWSQPPQYILSDGGQVDETVAYVNANPSVAERIEGVVANGKN
ncbi:MAG: ABC transporter substrate-binding protein, partial [Myxococcota bacterium]